MRDIAACKTLEDFEKESEKIVREYAFDEACLLVNVRYKLMRAKEALEFIALNKTIKENK